MIARTRVTTNVNELQDYETSLKGNQMLPHDQQVPLEAPKPVIKEVDICLDINKISLAFECRTDSSDSIVIHYEGKQHYLVFEQDIWDKIKEHFSNN